MKKIFIILLVFNSVIFSQWEPINLTPFAGRIDGFYMTDSLNITAAFKGDSCHFIKSSDGGRNWSLQQKIPIPYMSEVVFIDQNNVFVLGGLSRPPIMKKTSNGGISWNDITIPERYYDLNEVQFFGTDIAYAKATYKKGTSDAYMLLKTSDGGTSWNIIDSSITKIYSFRFIDSQNGWIFGDQTYRTTNGGLSFTVFSTPQTMQHVRSVDVMNDNIIVLGGYRDYSVPPYYNSKIAQTAFSTDGGNSWNYRDFGDIMFEGYPTKIRLLNSNTAVSINYWYQSSGVLYTTDQGLTWGIGTGPERSYDFNEIKLHGGRVYVAGDGAVFLASGTDISQKWELRLDDSDSQFSAAGFYKSGLVVVASNNGRINVSTDRGKNWTMKVKIDDVPKSICIVNDSLLYLAASSRIYRSTNNCKTLDSIAYLSGGKITDLKLSPDGQLWLTNGAIIYSSSDNGLSWFNRYQVSNTNFSELQVFGDGRLYATNGVLHRSTNNGDTWSKLSSSLNANNIEFYDSKNGFIGGKGSYFYRTPDGGTYFGLFATPGMISSQSIYCKDSLNFIIGTDKLYSTYDGGRIWMISKFSTPPSGYDFDWMHLFDLFDGIIIGKTRGVWITNNQGNTPVELSLFSALPFGNKVVLQWTTETETNNMGFEIERKYKYGDWKKIAFSKGSGTSTRKIFYGYDDYEPKAPAILYYRLKQIDYNGEFEYSNEVEVSLGEIPENYSIQQNYPNPFNPSTKVTFSLPEENKVVIKVFNALGEQVKEIDRGVLSHGYFEQDFEMSNESSGMYFCQVLCTNTISGRTKSLTVKMVLMK